MSEFRFKDGKTVEEHWTEKITKHLVGRTIKKIEYISIDEMETNLWYKRPISILLDNGHWITPIMDDEGNDGGAISTTFKELGTIPVI
tara:strand:+ start:357 stop:620 length:264 start_codon:yes stop_codon:yes gene_type:complete